MKSDALCYLSDDVLFFEDTVEKMINKFSYYFPDFDGVLGLYQENLPIEQQVKCAFGIIGTKFANRFPQRKVFCLDYWRFYMDKELLLLIENSNKFVFDKEVKIKHLHPAITGIADKTHKYNRKYLQRDRETFYLRRKKNWLWGRDYNLIIKEK